MATSMGRLRSGQAILQAVARIRPEAAAASPANARCTKGSVP